MHLTARLTRKLLCSNLGVALIDNKRRQSKTIYLTFDDGPHPVHSNKIIELLAKFNIKATFFLLGVNIERERSTAERMVTEGHLLGNHTYSHKILSLITKREMLNEIERCQVLVESMQTSSTLKLFRPPQGLIDLISLATLRTQNFIPMYWTIDSKDHLTGIDIYRRLKQLPHQHNIILFHDDNNICLEPLADLIPVWIEQGFEFVIPTI